MKTLSFENGKADLADLLPEELRFAAIRLDQTMIPSLARNPRVAGDIEDAVRRVPTHHRLYLGDSRDMSMVEDESVQLVVTSPPYWTLKEYPANAAQLGAVDDYDGFLAQLDEVWRECLRVLVPGGRIVVVVGDVCLPRRRFGRHSVFPLHASIQEHCRAIGLDNLAPIIWHKIANARYEVAGGGGFLGKPYEPNAIIKNDVEYILFLRKPGGYRSPSSVERVLSLIPEEKHREWFQQIWTVPGASTRDHPAPFPLQLAERLVRMFSFVGDTVLDPFMGTGTVTLASSKWGRNSVGVEVEEDYLRYAARRLAESGQSQLPFVHVEA